MCTCFARPVNGCSNKQTSPEWPIFSIVALFYVSLLQVVIWCLMTLHIALSIPFLLPWLTHTHTQRSVTHGEVSDASMDAAAELLKGGIWSFSPLSRWNVNTPVAWICQMSTWYFKVASWLWLFFCFKLEWEARLFCIMFYEQALTHIQCCSPQTCSVGDTGWAGQAGPHMHMWMYTHWHHTHEHKKERSGTQTCMLWTHMHTPLCHSLTWFCV